MPRPPFAALPRLRPAPLRRVPQLLLAALLLGGAGGCRAADRDAPLPPRSDFPAPPGASASGPLHWPVAAARPLQAEDPVLQVALAARLGPGPGAAAAGAAPLRLQAAGGGMLTLIDAGGQRFMAPSLTLHWRREPLPQPLELRRQAIGPFASFESAEQAAEGWRALGVETVIARPQEWEVWAGPDAPAPAGMTPRRLERRETQRLALELRRAEGTVPLEGPIRITAAGGLRWGKGVFAGPFLLKSDAHGRWSLVEEVPLERYLLGVVPHEIGAGSPPAALAAQAVLARTWAVRNHHRFAADGYHLCADTQCQVYADPRQAGAAVRQAVAASRNRVLAWRGEPIHAVYHATNGGMAAGFEEGWSGEPLPYLRAFADGPEGFGQRFGIPLAASTLPALLNEGGSAYGAGHPLFRWQRRLTAGEIATALGPRAAAVGQPTQLKVLERGPSGRVLALEISGGSGREVLRLDAIRRTLRRLPSTLFTLTPAGAGAWQLSGGGFGHGAGLSQAGAIDLARRGWSLERILDRYYPGASLQPLTRLADAP